MKKIRIGKDIAIEWKITTSEGESLSDINLTIWMKDPKGTKVLLENYEVVDDNTITIGLKGTAFVYVGKYTLTAYKNEGLDGQSVVDAIDAFELVSSTDKEDGCGCGCGVLNISTVDLYSDLEFLVSGLKGDPFTYDDFTPEQIEGLKVKGDKGDKGEKGDKGDPFKYSDFTPEQLASLKGDKGDKGEKGDKGDRGLQGLKGDTGAKGETGDTGFSPIAKVESTSDGAKVTITDKSGTTTANIVNGVDGFTPSANVSKSGKTTTITVTDAEGTTTAEVLDGEVEEAPDNRFYVRCNKSWYNTVVQNIDIDISKYIGGMFISQTDLWVAPTGSIEAYNIPVVEGATYVIKTPSNLAASFPAVYAITADEPVAGETVLYADGYRRTTANKPNEIITLKIPKGGKYLMFSYHTNSGYTIPQYIKECRSENPLYEAAEAIYNYSNDVIVRTDKYGNNVEHLPDRWYLNGLGDITDEEMTEIYNRTNNWWFSTGVGSCAYGSFRTNIVVSRGDYLNHKVLDFTRFWRNNNQLEVLIFSSSGTASAQEAHYIQHLDVAFHSCSKLRVIDGLNVGYYASTPFAVTTFTGCTSLETLIVNNLRHSIPLKDCLKLSNASVLNMIEKAYPQTSSVTITLHPDVYDRVMTDTDIQTALAEKTNITIAQ